MSDALNTIEHNVGLAGFGDNYFRGYSVADELAGSDGFWSLISLAASGPRLDAPTTAFLDELTACSVATDPRIWPFKIAWLVGAYGSPIAAMSAVQTMLADALVGPLCTIAAIDTLVELDGAGGDEGVAAILQECRATRRALAGFGVPARRVDERVVMLRRCVRRHGRERGHYWSLVERADRVVEREGIAFRPNLGIAVAACLLDVGFDPDQVPWITVATALPSMWANATSAGAAQVESLRALPADTAEYRGASGRVSPRASGRT